MKKLAIGCGAFVVVAGVSFIAFAVWLFIELPALDATLLVPSTVQFDTEMRLVVTATNNHTDDIVLDSIDIQDSFLEG